MSSFVGRTRELTKLEERVSVAVHGRGGVVFITGEPGAGKSTLLGQVQERVSRERPDILILNADCSEQYGAGEPYQPFVEAFRDILTAAERRPSRRKLKELAAKVAPMWVQVVPVVGDMVSAAMGTMMEFRKEGAAPNAPSEEALFLQYTELLFTAAEDHPILLVIDDLHWADRASVALFMHLARKVASERVLMVGTYRPVDVEAAAHPIRDAKLELERYGLAEEIALSPLESDALRELVHAETGAPPTRELLDWLERRAGSNPLFFSELLKWLLERGFARTIEGELDLVRPPGEVEIPRTAESVIERRLSRLPAELRRILEYASIEGNEFGSTTLAQLLDMDELALEEALEPLVRVHRLIRLLETRELPSGEISSVYEFGHSLIQDVLVGGIQGKRRILLHRRMAEILEREYAPDVDIVSHKLALHYDEGRQPGRAYRYALRAAERARQLYAHPDAIELIRRALTNARTDGEKGEALDRLGDAQREAGRLPDALATFAAALEIADAAGQPLRALALKRRILAVERERGARPPDMLSAEVSTLKREAEALVARAELCQILFLEVELPPGPSASPEHAAQEALRIAQELSDPPLIARAHHVLGTALMYRDPAAAIETIAAGLRLQEELGDRNRVGRCHNDLAIAYIMVGDYRRAVEEFATAAAIFVEVGDPVLTGLIRNNLAVLYTRTGEHERAESQLREALRRLGRAHAGARLLHPMENLATLYALRGEHAAAAEQWRALERHARECGNRSSQVIAHCGLGITHVEAGDLAAARTELATAQELLHDPEAWSEARQAVHDLAARVANAEGDPERALRWVGEAEAELETRDRFAWASFRLMRGEILARDDPAAAVPVLEEGAATFEQLGCESLRRRAEALLATNATHR